MSNPKTVDENAVGSQVAGVLIALLFGLPLAFHVIGYLVA